MIKSTFISLILFGLLGCRNQTNSFSANVKNCYCDDDKMYMLKIYNNNFAFKEEYIAVGSKIEIYRFGTIKQNDGKVSFICQGSMFEGEEFSNERDKYLDMHGIIVNDNIRLTFPSNILLSKKSCSNKIFNFPREIQSAINQ